MKPQPASRKRRDLTFPLLTNVRADILQDQKFRLKSGELRWVRTSDLLIKRTAEAKDVPDMPKLTKRTVDALAVTVDDYPTWDRHLRGFGVRVYPSGKKTYLVKYRVGRRTRASAPRRCHTW